MIQEVVEFSPHCSLVNSTVHLNQINASIWNSLDRGHSHKQFTKYESTGQISEEMSLIFRKSKVSHALSKGFIYKAIVIYK